MNHLRSVYNTLLEAKFRLMEFKLRSNTTASYLCMQALTEAIVECDTLASIQEQEQAKKIQWVKERVA